MARPDLYEEICDFTPEQWKFLIERHLTMVMRDLDLAPDEQALLRNTNQSHLWRRTHEPGQFVQEPNERQKNSADRIRLRFRQFRNTIEITCPASRERSLAITHLEDACTRAIQAIMYHKIEGED